MIAASPLVWIKILLDYEPHVIQSWVSLYYVLLIALWVISTVLAVIIVRSGMRKFGYATFWLTTGLVLFLFGGMQAFLAR